MARSPSRRTPDVYRSEYNRRVQKNLGRGLSYSAATGHVRRDDDGMPTEMSARDANDFAKGGSERLADLFKSMDDEQKTVYLASVQLVKPTMTRHDIWSTLLGSAP